MARELGRGLDPDSPPELDRRSGFQDITQELPPEVWDEEEEEGLTISLPTGSGIPAPTPAPAPEQPEGEQPMYRAPEDGAQ